MFRTLLVLVALVAAAAFSPARVIARSNMALSELAKSSTGKTECEVRKACIYVFRAFHLPFSNPPSPPKKTPTPNHQSQSRKIDKNGRCPGEAGYVSFTKADDRSFAEIKAEQEVQILPRTCTHTQTQAALFDEHYFLFMASPPSFPPACTRPRRRPPASKAVL